MSQLILLSDGGYHFLSEHGVRACKTNSEGRLYLRREIFTLNADGFAVPTGEQAPITPELLEVLKAHHSVRNNWNYDHPHLPTEVEGDDPGFRAKVIASVQEQMATSPFPFEIMAIQRRWLRYYSDGYWNTQRRFLRLAPVPNNYPYDADHNPLPQFVDGPTLADVLNYMKPDPDYPGRSVTADDINHSRPLLYDGPAWVLSFKLDEQFPAYGGCHVYLDDDGNFLCSDWCQRSGRDVKENGGGIDLQVAEYTLAGWITGPCIKRAARGGKFTPKSAKTRLVEVRTAAKQAGPAVLPSISDLIAKHESAISRMLRAGATFDFMLASFSKSLEQGDVAAINKVPVRLSRAREFSQETRDAYAKCVVNAAQSSDGFIACEHYTKDKAPAMVKPWNLEIDAERLQQLAAPKAFTPEEIEALKAAFLVPQVSAPAPNPYRVGFHECKSCGLMTTDGVTHPGHNCYHPEEATCLLVKLQDTTNLLMIGGKED